jgi:uncharacterized protein involved in exopolysaccharide biosynthesis
MTEIMHTEKSSVLDFILPESAWPQLREQLKDAEKRIDSTMQQLVIARAQVHNWEENLAGAKAQRAILIQQLGESPEQQRALLIQQKKTDTPKTDP